jgi:hypothetical protein
MANLARCLQAGAPQVTNLQSRSRHIDYCDLSILAYSCRGIDCGQTVSSRSSYGADGGGITYEASLPCGLGQK